MPHFLRILSESRLSVQSGLSVWTSSVNTNTPAIFFYLLLWFSLTHAHRQIYSHMQRNSLHMKILLNILQNLVRQMNTPPLEVLCRASRARTSLSYSWENSEISQQRVDTCSMLAVAVVKKTLHLRWLLFSARTLPRALVTLSADWNILLALFNLYFDFTIRRLSRAFSVYRQS